MAVHVHFARLQIEVWEERLEETRGGAQVPSHPALSQTHSSRLPVTDEDPRGGSCCGQRWQVYQKARCNGALIKAVHCSEIYSQLIQLIVKKANNSVKN